MTRAAGSAVGKTTWMMGDAAQLTAQGFTLICIGEPCWFLEAALREYAARPTFASTRDLALEGDPDCVRGPLVGDPCARDEEVRDRSFGEDAANGTGTRTSAKVGTLV